MLADNPTGTRRSLAYFFADITIDCEIGFAVAVVIADDRSGIFDRLMRGRTEGSPRKQCCLTFPVPCGDAGSS